MADREPRRRKRRKDSQKRDDVRSDETIFLSSSKSEIRDSDQEVEEEYEVHSHGGPSMFSQVIFVILFSGLVVSMGVIFMSLQSVDKGSSDIFESSHGDHAEALQDNHMSEALFGDEDAVSDDQEHDIKEATLDDHGDTDDEVSLENLIESGINTLSSFFSTKEDGEVEETTTEPMHETEKPLDDISTESYTSADEATDQEMEYYIENHMEESASEAVTEETAYTDAYTTPVSSFHDDFSYSETEDLSTPQPGNNQPMQSNAPEEEYEVPTSPDANIFESEGISFYEKSDLTNDYEMEDELDDIERSLEKESSIDDDDDEEEDEESDDEDEPEDEFDFWQF